MLLCGQFEPLGWGSSVEELDPQSQGCSLGSCLLHPLLASLTYGGAMPLDGTSPPQIIYALFK
jgi:hypothetical protein